jgi:hypothetical protein
MLLDDFYKLVAAEAVALGRGINSVEQAATAITRHIDAFAVQLGSNQYLPLLARNYILETPVLSRWHRRTLAAALENALSVAPAEPAATPETNSETITHEDLIDVCQKIGSVAESNSGYTAHLAAWIKDKDFKTMTVSDLLRRIETARACYNIMHGAK